MTTAPVFVCVCVCVCSIPMSSPVSLPLQVTPTWMIRWEGSLYRAMLLVSIPPHGKKVSMGRRFVNDLNLFLRGRASPSVVRKFHGYSFLIPAFVELPPNLSVVPPPKGSFVVVVYEQTETLSVHEWTHLPDGDLLPSSAVPAAKPIDPVLAHVPRRPRGGAPKKLKFDLSPLKPAHSARTCSLGDSCQSGTVIKTGDGEYSLISVLYEHDKAFVESMEHSILRLPVPFPNYCEQHFTSIRRSGCIHSKCRSDLSPDAKLSVYTASMGRHVCVVCLHRINHASQRQEDGHGFTVCSSNGDAGRRIWCGKSSLTQERFMSTQRDLMAAAPLPGRMSSMEYERNYYDESGAILARSDEYFDVFLADKTRVRVIHEIDMDASKHTPTADADWLTRVCSSLSMSLCSGESRLLVLRTRLIPDSHFGIWSIRVRSLLFGLLSTPSAETLGRWDVCEIYLCARSSDFSAQRVARELVCTMPDPFLGMCISERVCPQSRRLRYRLFPPGSVLGLHTESSTLDRLSVCLARSTCDTLPWLVGRNVLVGFPLVLHPMFQPAGLMASLSEMNRRALEIEIGTKGFVPELA